MLRIHRTRTLTFRERFYFVIPHVVVIIESLVIVLSFGHLIPFWSFALMQKSLDILIKIDEELEKEG